MQAVKALRLWVVLSVGLFSMVINQAARAQPVLPLPPRESTAMTGSQFYDTITELTDVQREEAVLKEIQNGNVPKFLRRFVPVEVEVTTGGRTHQARFYVTPDYVAVGSDDSFFRMPMSATLAQQVANLTSCTLPTRKMVDNIYRHARKLTPHPFSPAEFEITSPTVWWLSQQAIQDQFTSAGLRQGELVSGIKKDIVVTPLLLQRPPPPRVAIYGWHKLDGKPIQPLSLVHKANYKDYSHGVRLVWREVEVDGKSRSVEEVLNDPDFWPLLSDEGQTTVTRYAPVP